MSSEVVKRGLRLVTFAVATSLSLILTSVLLRIPLGKSVVGLVLIGGLFFAVVYVFAKYLTMLWRASNRFSAVVVGRSLKLVGSHATQTAEKA